MVAQTTSIDHGEVLHPRRLPIAALALAALSAALLVAPVRVAGADAPTGLDPTYGVNGQAVVPNDGHTFVLHGSSTDVQGRTTILGFHSPDGLYRFTATGAVDTTFGSGGFAALPDGFVAALKVESGPFGVLVPGGTAAGPAVLLLDDSGNPMPTKGNEGVVPFSTGDLAGASAWSAALAPDGSLYAIVGVGAFGDHYYLEHRAADGSVDPNFGVDGSVRLDAPTGSSVYSFDLIVDRQGRVVVAENEYRGGPVHAYLHRIAPDGSPDLTFGDRGVVDLGGPFVWTVVEDPHDGSLVAAGSVDVAGSQTAVVTRVTSAGRLDPRFGTGGHAPAAPSGFSSQVAWGAVVLPSGQIGVTSDAGTAGVSSTVSVLQPDGSPDAAFGTGGAIPDPRYVTDFGGIGVGSNGQLLVAAAGISSGGSVQAPSSVWAYAVDQTHPLPTVTNVVPRPGGLTLTWSPPADPPFGAIRAYHLMAFDAANHIAAQDIVAGDVTHGSLTGLANGTGYRVVILPYSTSGTDWASAPVTGTPSATGPAITAAAVPQHVTTTTGHSNITVSWMPPADDGGSPIVGYSVVAVHQDSGTLAAWRNVRADLRQASLDGLIDGSTYRAFVVADTAQGFGAAVEVDGVTPTASPVGQRPLTTWVSALPIGSSAVVSWGPPAEQGQPLTKWNVIVIQGGAMTAWKVLGPEQRQTTVPLAASGDAQVYVVPQSAEGYGPLGTPVTVTP